MHWREGHLPEDRGLVILRLFVVDDAPFIRKALARVLSADPDIKIVGEASGGLEALEKIPGCRPDLVTMDVDMPELDGLATLRRLRRSLPELPVIMMSAHTSDGAETTLQALSDGAVDFIDKKSINVMDFAGLSREVLEKIKCWEPVGENGSNRPGRNQGASKQPQTDLPKVCWSRYRLCVIGASTGGPQALEKLLAAVPGDFPCPIVIVQHMPKGFTRPFADRLNTVSDLLVQEARQGLRLTGGVVAVAPAGLHLRIGRNLEVNLTKELSDSVHRPSIDVTMYSAACSLDPRQVAGVLLTGMGNDGAEGMFAIHDKGGLTIAEREESCVVPGMPRAAYLRGAVSIYETLPRILSLFGAGGGK